MAKKRDVKSARSSGEPDEARPRTQILRMPFVTGPRGTDSVAWALEREIAPILRAISALVKLRVAGDSSALTSMLSDVTAFIEGLGQFLQSGEFPDFEYGGDSRAFDLARAIHTVSRCADSNFPPDVDLVEVLKTLSEHLATAVYPSDDDSEEAA